MVSYRSLAHEPGFPGAAIMAKCTFVDPGFSGTSPGSLNADAQPGAAALQEGGRSEVVAMPGGCTGRQGPALGLRKGRRSPVQTEPGSHSTTNDS